MHTPNQNGGTVVCQNTFARPNLYLGVRKKKGGGGGCFDDVLGCMEEAFREEGKRGVLTGFPFLPIFLFIFLCCLDFATLFFFLQ